MTIDKSDPRLTAYALDELSELEKLSFETELGESKSAQHELSEIQHTLSDLRIEFAEGAPRQLDKRRYREIETAARAARTKVTAKGQSRRRRIWVGVSLGAVAASALLLTMTGARNELAHDGAATRTWGSHPEKASEPASARLTGDERPPPVPIPDSRLAAAPSERGVRESPSRAPRAAAAAGPLNKAPSGKMSFDNPFNDTAPRALAGAVAAAPNDVLVPSPSAGAVKAGEWDDNANYREFTRWLASGPAPAAHFMDLRERRFIVVRDAAGLGVPACSVVIEDEAERRAELVTAANGRAILFPHAEGLSGPMLTASTSCGSGAQTRFRLTQGDGVVELRLATRRALGERSIDVAFILDSTGSMNEEIGAVQATIQKVASALRDSNVRIRVGLVEYKDRGDTYVSKVFPLSGDLTLFAQQVAAISASGGGDTPESVNEALHAGVEQLAWNGDAFAKLAFLIGDAPPHLDYAQDYDYVLEAREAAHRGIQVFTVAASGMDTLGQVVWRQVAAYTGATNLFVLRGGAGPQSTGAGDPKSSCGGTQTAYTSGNLDTLILAKIRGAIRALDRDPLRIPGLNADENSKPCDKRVLVQ